MSSIFYNVEPRPLNPELACLIGLNESIVLQQLHYWLEKNKKKNTNFRDGRFWTYGTIQEYRDRDFPWWSYETVKRTLSRLISMGLLLQGSYNKMKMDHTKWYSIDYEAWDEWLDKNAPKRDDLALGQNDPIEQVKMTQSNRSDCSKRTGQSDPNEQVRLP